MNNAGAESGMQMTYYDQVSGTYRYKRRFVWAALALVLGVISGMITAGLL